MEKVSSIDDEVDELMQYMVSSGKLGKEFVPETDAVRILKESPLIRQAVVSGKGSEQYQNAILVAKRVMGILIDMQQRGLWEYTPNNMKRKSMEMTTITITDNNGVFKRRQGPYRGSYGKYFDEKGYYGRR